MNSSKMNISQINISQMNISKVNISKMNISKMIISRMNISKMSISNMSISNMNTVEPACKVLGFVQQKLTIQQGFCCLTLQPSIFVNKMATWGLLKLTLHPF